MLAGIQTSRSLPAGRFEGVGEINAGDSRQYLQVRIIGDDGALNCTRGY